MERVLELPGAVLLARRQFLVSLGQFQRIHAGLLRV